MEVLSSAPISSSSSTLNPDAPMFVPLAYRTVEDFSDQWWSLVHSSPWFRHYWLRECFQDPQYDDDDEEEEDEDALSLFYQLDHHPHEDEEGGREGKELVSLGVLKWRRCGAWAHAPRYVEKPPKFFKPKPSPRAIHQPK